MIQNCSLSLPIPLYTHIPEPKSNTTEVRESSFNAREVCIGSKRTICGNPMWLLSISFEYIILFYYIHNWNKSYMILKILKIAICIFTFGTLGLARLFLLTMKAKSTNICNTSNKTDNTWTENLQWELPKESNRDLVYRWPVFQTDQWKIQFSIITKGSGGNLLAFRVK